MTTYQIENSISGIVLGTWEADDEGGALDAMARDAGYRDYDALDAEIPAEDGEILVAEIAR